MLGHDEEEEIRALIYDELADLHEKETRPHGSYAYLCNLGGLPTYTHSPVGRVLDGPF